MKADLGVVASYTDALFQTALKRGSLERLATDIRGLQNSLTAESREKLTQVFESPNIPREKKESVFVKLYGGRVDELFVNFARMLIRRGRLEVLRPSIDLFLQRYDEHRGFLRATVVTAIALTDGEKERLRTAMSRSLGKTLLIDYKVDPGVIGGVRFQCGDVLIDSTISRSLTTLRARLKSTDVH